MKFLKRKTPEFILPLLWPPNSPDFDPVDYSVWSILQKKVYKTRITDLDNLKHRVRTEWAKLLQLCVSAIVIAQLVRAGGGHFEHCF